MTLASLLDTPLAHRTGLLLLAVLLGGLVGWERERQERPAGLRTHILVCVGAALMTLVGDTIPNNGARIAAQIVTGVGFLGAGTIIRENDTMGTPVRGLTTAASLWATAGVGIAVGLGGLSAQLATVGTVIILFTLTLLNSLEDTLNRRRRRQSLMLVFRSDTGGDPLDAISRVLDILRGRDVKTRNLTLEKSADSVVVRLQLSLPHHTSREALSPIFTSDKSILHSEWRD